MKNERIIKVWGKKSIDIGNGIILCVDAGSAKKKQFMAAVAVGITVLTAIIGIITVALTAPKASAKEMETIEVSMVQYSPAPVAMTYEVEEEEIEIPATPMAKQEPEYESIGTCRITAYCACKKCCGKWAQNRPLDENGEEIVVGAEGTRLISGVSVAGKWDFGTELYIPAVSEEVFVVQDRTAKHIQEYYDGMVVDIYIDGHDECYAYVADLPEWTEVYTVVVG